MALALTYAIVRDAFEKVFSDDALFGCIFGSVLDERFREDSDIDLAVWMRDRTAVDRMSRLCEDLADQLDRDIDLINLRARSRTAVNPRRITWSTAGSLAPGEPNHEESRRDPW